MGYKVQITLVTLDAAVIGVVGRILDMTGEQHGITRCHLPHFGGQSAEQGLHQLLGDMSRGEGSGNEGGQHVSRLGACAGSYTERAGCEAQHVLES